jgi:hypothetical protein
VLVPVADGSEEIETVCIGACCCCGWWRC